MTGTYFSWRWDTGHCAARAVIDNLNKKKLKRTIP